jgi:hypothetical protein
MVASRTVPATPDSLRILLVGINVLMSDRRSNEAAARTAYSMCHPRVTFC